MSQQSDADLKNSWFLSEILVQHLCRSHTLLPDVNSHCKLLDIYSNTCIVTDAARGQLCV